MVVSLIVRAGVVYAIIMATKNYGVWDSQDVAQDVYAEAVDYIEPYADKARRQLKICPPRPPAEGEWSFFGIHYYNQLVKSFFDVLSLVPYGLEQVLQKVPGFITSLIENVRKLIPEGGRSKKKEITISKGQLDETPLVRPHCQDKNCPKTPLIPPCGPRRKPDSFIYEPRMPKKPRCECSKCKERLREKWQEKECTKDETPREGKCACGEPISSSKKKQRKQARDISKRE